MTGEAGRRGRVRLVRQTELAECGLASIAMVVNSYGSDIDLASMRHRFAVSMRGTGLRTLIEIGDHLGFASRPVSLGLEDLHRLTLPAILHWNLNHFVVLERVSGRKALIHDPDGGTAWMPLNEVSRRFTGVALELWPTSTFTPEVERRRIKLSSLWERVFGIKRALAQTVLLSVLMQVFVLISPYYIQIAIDAIIPASDMDLLIVLAGCFGLIALLNALTALLRAHVMLNASTALGFGIAVNVTRRLFRLPVSWFERRSQGDILSRLQSIAPVQQFLTEGAVSAMVDGALALAILAIMMFYSVKLTGIVLTATAVYFSVRAWLFSRQRKAQEASVVATAKEQTVLLESLHGIRTIRLFGHEPVRHALWQSRRAAATNAEVRLARVGVWSGVANVLVYGIENILTVLVAVSFIIQGAGFSIGMLFAFVAYRGQLVQRMEKLTDQVFRFKLLSFHLERLSDIVGSSEDAGFASGIPARSGNLEQIEIRDVSFRYSSSEAYILRNASLSIRRGDHLAITGSSGSGKSTMVKILLGLVEPEDGGLFVNGTKLSHYGSRNYQGRLGAVMQDDVLFSGSIAANIALFDDMIDLKKVEMSARTAAVHEEIACMPMGYETLVGDMGSTLSGGQRQRIILARALYRDPDVLIMDEGTAHLDAANEARVNHAIKQLGITLVVIAHSEETVAAADRVMVLDRGQLTLRRQSSVKT